MTRVAPHRAGSLARGVHHRQVGTGRRRDGSVQGRGHAAIATCPVGHPPPLQRRSGPVERPCRVSSARGRKTPPHPPRGDRQTRPGPGQRFGGSDRCRTSRGPARGPCPPPRALVFCAAAAARRKTARHG